LQLDTLKIDPTAVEQGQWVADIPDMGDLEFKVRGVGNADYRRLQGKLLRAVPRSQRTDLSPEQQDEIAGKLLLETCLLDWRNLTDADKKVIPYSKELASDLLLKPEYTRFRDAVAYAAASVGEQQAQDVEADSKN
jgi:hypothetical protein